MPSFRHAFFGAVLALTACHMPAALTPSATGAAAQPRPIATAV
jgi:hypothetical protein